MIDINLIPPGLRKDGKGTTSSLTINFPQETLIGVGAGLVLIILIIHLFLGAVWLLETGRLAQVKSGWDAVTPDKKILDAINDESKVLKKNIDMISGMTTNASVLWAPKFNAISDSLPKGLWLRKMTLDRVGLSMEGSVVSKNQSEITNVGLFLSNLKDSEAFMDGFASLEVNSIQRSKSNSIDVTDFTVMAKLK